MLDVRYERETMRLPKELEPRMRPTQLWQQRSWDFPTWEWHGIPPRNNTRIEIEKFAKPVLITCGDKDEVWESARTRRIKATLKKGGRAPRSIFLPMRAMNSPCLRSRNGVSW